MAKPYLFETRPRKWYQFMLDIAWPELMIIGIVAVVAIGPKDLPKVMNTLGQWVGKARDMTQNMQRSFDRLAYESEVAEQLKADKAKAKPKTKNTKAKTAPAKPAVNDDDSHGHLGST